MWVEDVSTCPRNFCYPLLAFTNGSFNPAKRTNLSWWLICTLRHNVSDQKRSPVTLIPQQCSHLVILYLKSPLDFVLVKNSKKGL